MVLDCRLGYGGLNQAYRPTIPFPIDIDKDLDSQMKKESWDYDSGAVRIFVLFLSKFNWLC